MKYLSFLLIFAVTFALQLAYSAEPMASQGDQWLAIPGKQVGPINKDTAEADLIRLFGRENIQDVTITQSEGMLETGTLVFPNNPVMAFKIIWQDKTLKQRPVAIIVNDQRTTVTLDEDGLQSFDTTTIKNNKSLWHTAEGVTLGMSVQELERLNGRPFLITAQTPTCIPVGMIDSWNHGKLAVKGLSIQLDQEEWNNSLNNSGRSLIRSNHHRVRKSNLKVMDMTFSVGNEPLPEPEAQ